MPQDDEDSTQATPGYALGQLWRAVAAAQGHPDPATRERAVAKASSWSRVIDGMVDGTLSVGSRTPVANTPAWVTLEVAHGGFATGAYLAEQPLRADETAVLGGGRQIPGSTDRERLNLFYLSDAGQAVLRDALREGRFRVELPEDAALLVATWLLAHERYAEGLDLVGELRPLMHRLRFTPALDAVPGARGATVRLETAGDVAFRLCSVRVPEPISTMRATLGVWHPLFDRLVELWCDTVDGELPLLSGSPAVVTGGWPCRRWPADWAQRRASWLDDYAAAVAEYDTSGRQAAPKSDFARLRTALERCGTDSSALTGRDVGWIRRALANTLTRHGGPGSALRTRLRATQARMAEEPTHAAVAAVLVERVSRYPAEGGLAALEPVIGDVEAGESAEVPAGVAVPRSLVRTVTRALEAPAGELVDRGVIPSGEVLARVLPQITAEIMAADIDDPELGAVHRQAYTAFRRRRSLLLLNLESQVRFTELPWIAAVQPMRRGSAAAAHSARRALDEATGLALRAFPHTILPNPLVRELSAMAAKGNVTGPENSALPLVQEIAADIFMGTFTEKWLRAALMASTLLDGTVYARYYDLPTPDDWTPRPAGRLARLVRATPPPEALDFDEVCRHRAGEAQSAIGAAPSWVAANGAVLEQSQILTTHNLAVLVEALNRHRTMAETGAALAERVFHRVLSDLRRPAAGARPVELRVLKNGAYAWRQAIFFLSFCDRAEQDRLVDQLRGAVYTAPDLGRSFQLVVDGLAHVVRGGRFDVGGTVSGPRPGRRYLGWSVGPHWLARESTVGV